MSEDTIKMSLSSIFSSVLKNGCRLEECNPHVVKMSVAPREKGIKYTHFMCIDGLSQNEIQERYPKDNVDYEYITIRIGFGVLLIIERKRSSEDRNRHIDLWKSYQSKYGHLVSMPERE